MHGSHVLPTIWGLLAHKRQLFQQDAAAARILRPALAGYFQCILRGLLTGHLRNGEVWNIRPLLFARQALGVQLVMQVAHARGGVVHADVHGWRNGDKSLHVAQTDFEGLRAATHSFQNLKRSALGSLDRSWRQQSKMRRQMRQIGMQLPPQVLHELSHRTRDVSYQRVTRVLHIRIKIITRFPLSYSAELQKSAQCGAQPAPYSVVVTLVAKSNRPASRPACAASARVIICAGRISTMG